MAELRSYICPNCGANTTNTDNCEYCGSLLVRFVEKGIDLSKTSYTSNVEVFPGLIKELEQNLALQKQGDKGVVTDIYRAVGKEGETSDGTVLSVLRTGKSVWSDDQDIKLSNSDKGLVIALGFSTCVDEKSNTDFNREMERQLALFKQLPCYELFTSHRCFYTDEDGEKRKGIEYAIDFGQDAEGAARLISEIMVKVYGVPLDEDVEFYTNVGDNIDKSREQVKAARTGGSVDCDNDSYDDDDDDDENGRPIPVWQCALGVIIFILWWLLS